ncbi:MAG TPA: alpha-ribazole phosphatase [Sphingobacteriaceae bacterium]|nr:alpha-ribazole phosphatase [Sphingobacteriaceae bacterium]
MVRSVYLVRHGQTPWNKAGRYQGHTDIPLSPLGRRQALCLARRLARDPIDAVYSSDLTRAQATAAPLARRLDLPVRARSDLREMAYGDLEGLTAAQIEERFPGYFPAARQDPLGTTPPGGESYSTMYNRVLAAWEEIAGGPHDRVLVVAHGGTLKALLCHLLAVDPRERWRFMLDNASITILHRRRSGFSLWRYNDTHHLRDLHKGKRRRR